MNQPQLTVQYLILRPEQDQVSGPRGPRPAVFGADPAKVLAVDGPARRGGPVHIDLETVGTDPLAPDAAITTLAIANDLGVWVWDPRGWDSGAWDLLAAALTHAKWAAFNVMFDGAWLAARLGRLPPIECCTFVLFRMLANEDWPGQRWRLEIAQHDILGWPDSNKDRLQELMWKHGFSNKKEMWRLADLAPAEYQRYCAEDADASWQLRQRLETLATLTIGATGWAAVWQLASNEWSTSLGHHIEQQLRGMAFDSAGAQLYFDELCLQIRRIEGQLRAHPALAPHIEAWERGALEAAVRPTITIKRHRASKAERLEQVLRDPRWIFVPSEAKSLPAWQAAEGGFWVREEVVVKAPDTPEPARCNWESDPWLRWLLWGQPIKTAPEGSGGAFAARVVMQDVEGAARPHFRDEAGALTMIPLTETGQMPVGKSVLPLLGEVGKLLLEASALTKRRGYVESYIAGAQAGLLHPRMRAHGTSTGRMSGGG